MNALLQGRYEIIQTLSAGGFGETYVAIDRQLPSQRKVVIKKFKPQHQYDARTYEIVRERFEREAVALEALADVCRHVPRLYAFFCEAGDYYLVQEFRSSRTPINSKTN
jgi:serine/threonine-protein kinase